ALGRSEGRSVFGGRTIEVHGAGRVAGADGDLVHVDVGRVQQAATLGHGQHTYRVGLVLGAEGRAFQRVDGDIHLRTIAGPDRLADVEHRRLVPLALADDDPAIDVDALELRPHGFDSSGVGGLLVALAAPSGSGGGGPL